VVAFRAPGMMLARASSAKPIRQFAILDAAAMQRSRSTAQASLRGPSGDVGDVAAARSPGSRAGAKAPRTRAAEIATKPGSTQCMRGRVVERLSGKGGVPAIDYGVFCLSVAGITRASPMNFSGSCGSLLTSTS